MMAEGVRDNVDMELQDGDQPCADDMNIRALVELANACPRLRRNYRYQRALKAFEVDEEGRATNNPILSITGGFGIQATLFEDGTVMIRAVAASNTQCGYGAELPALPSGLAWSRFDEASSNGRNDGLPKAISNVVRLRMEPASEAQVEAQMEAPARMYLFVGKYDRAEKRFVEVWAGIKLVRLSPLAALEAYELFAVEAAERRERDKIAAMIRRRAAQGSSGCECGLNVAGLLRGMFGPGAVPEGAGMADGPTASAAESARPADEKN